MRLLPLAFAGALVLTAGLARAQEPRAHEHEHGQPPAAAEQKADDGAEHKAMCACCADTDKMAAMKKEMMSRMGEMMKNKEPEKK